MKLALDGRPLAVIDTGDAPAAMAAAENDLIVVNFGSQTLQKIPLDAGGTTAR